MNTEVELTELKYNQGVSMPYFSSASYQCTLKALKNSECVIIQPIMKLEITTASEYASKVHSDLTRRNATTIHVNSTINEMTSITACIPLAKLTSYSSDIRKLTSGNATFTIHFDSYNQISQKEYDQMVKSQF